MSPTMIEAVEALLGALFVLCMIAAALGVGFIFLCWLNEAWRYWKHRGRAGKRT